MSKSKADLIRSVLETTWNEYNEWERKDCENAIMALASPNPRLYDTTEQDATSRPSGQTLPDAAAHGDTALEVHHIEGSSSTVTLAPVKVISVQNHLPAASPYESSPLTTRNIFTGDDSNDLPFIPFADDKTFDHDSHALRHKRFAWDHDYDPNSKWPVSRRLRLY